MQVDPDLVAINEKLREYKEAWDAYVDAWLVVRVGSPDWVYRWRLQAEHAMLATGRPGMTDEQVLKREQTPKPFLSTPNPRYVWLCVCAYRLLRSHAVARQSSRVVCYKVLSTCAPRTPLPKQSRARAVVHLLTCA